MQCELVLSAQQKDPLHLTWNKSQLAIC